MLPTRIVDVRARRRSEWVRGEQQLLPGLARAEGVDLLHSLGNTAPGRGRFRRITTIHDLIYLRHPQGQWVRAAGMALLLPLAAWRAHRVIAVSQATAEDLHRMLRLPRDRIDVVPNGVGEPRPGATPEAELRRQLDLGDRPVLLSVSAKRPHKNLLRLVEAHARLEAPRPLLVLPGYPTPFESEIAETAERLGTRADLRMPGWLDASGLEGLYALAAAFVFPSLYEGFGLPVLEAMRRGIPVATSARGSLGEVAGDAALLFDPTDIAAITTALHRVLTDPALAVDLTARGRERAALFTWERTADGVLASYERALSA